MNALNNLQLQRLKMLFGMLGLQWPVFYTLLTFLVWYRWQFAAVLVMLAMPGFMLYYRYSRRKAATGGHPKGGLLFGLGTLVLAVMLYIIAPAWDNVMLSGVHAVLFIIGGIVIGQLVSKWTNRKHFAAVLSGTSTRLMAFYTTVAVPVTVGVLISTCVPLLFFWSWHMFVMIGGVALFIVLWRMDGLRKSDPSTHATV